MVNEASPDKPAIARLLTQLASGDIDEQAFRLQMSQLVGTSDDPLLELAEDEADEYLRVLGRLTIFGKPMRPDPREVESGKDTLLLIARALEESWSLKQVRQALRRL
jgi:hypothetical protein